MSVDIKLDNSKLNSRYRPEIDGLRAFAVISVIIYHFNKEILPNGYFELICFVISGFVITSSLYQRPSKNFKDFISGFYERRTAISTSTISFCTNHEHSNCLFNQEPGTTLLTGLTLFGLSNIFLLLTSKDYFTINRSQYIHTNLVLESRTILTSYSFLIWFTGFGRQTKNGARNLFL